MPGATATADVAGVGGLGISSGLTADAAAGRYVVEAGRLIRAANAAALVAAEREHGASAARAAPRMERFTRAYLRAARTRVARGVRDALREPTKAEALRAAEAELREAEGRSVRVTSVISHRRTRLASVRSGGSPREAALRAVVVTERRHVVEHVRANSGRASGAARQAALTDASPGGARWRLGRAEEHTPGCVALDGAALPHSVLEHVHPPMHHGCACSLVPLEDGETALSHGRAVALARHAASLEDDGAPFDDRLAALAEGLGPSGFLDIARNPKLSAAADRRHRLHGRFAPEGGSLAPTHRPPSADATLAVARGAAPAEEVLRPRDWKDPPPPVGKLGEGKAGGYSSDKALGTNTSLGRVGEAAFVRIVGGRVIHPPGKGEQSPLDVRFDGYGFEVKAVSTKSTAYKATPKPFEIEEKEAFARELGVEPALAMVVVDSDAGKAHAYYRDGMQGGRLSKNTGWRYLGSTDLVDERADAAREGFDPSETRDWRGRWQTGAHDFGSDVEAAVGALGQGERVELDEPREVGTLLDDLAARARDAKARGESAPLYNLCKVAVKGTNLFCGRSEGIPRLEMPQLGGYPLPGSKAAAMVSPGQFADLTSAFVDELRRRGVKVTDETDSADQLKATQNELNGAKVAKMLGVLESGGKLLGGDDRLVVSRDGYIVDGHHRWASQVGYEYAEGKPVTLPVARVDLPIRTILRLANSYSAEMGLPQESVAAGGARAIEAFDPAERRDPTGRWSRSGGLTEEAASAIFDGFEHGGLRVKVDADDSHAMTDSTAGKATVVAGSILDGAKPVGYVERSFSVDPTGRLVAKHLNLGLNAEYRDRGFATALNRHAEEEYARLGVDRIELQAAWLGGYAWARAGYSFQRDPVGTARLILKGREADDWRSMLPPDHRADGDDLARAIGDGELRSEASIAGFGRDRAWTLAVPLAVPDSFAADDERVTIPAGERVWAGKLLMIGSAWNGVKAIPRLREDDALAQRAADAFARLDVRVTPDSIWGDDDDAFWDAVGELSEGFEFERLHPREHGRFRDKPRIDLLKGVGAAAPEAASDDPAHRYRPDRLDPDVAAIETYEDAERVLASIGVTDNDLAPPKPRSTPPNSFAPDDVGSTDPDAAAFDANFYREVAQATKDAARRFPQLAQGEDRLTGIRLLRRSDRVFSGLQGMLGDVWGITGPDPRTTTMTPELGPTYVVINPWNTRLAEERIDGLSPADSTTYGRTMHELGHAVARASGLTYHDQLDGMERAKVGPRDVARFSLYAASSPQEGWAEAFTTLNTPHALDDVPVVARKKLLALRTSANARRSVDSYSGGDGRPVL